METGKEELYQYDSVEKTVQRYNTLILDMYKERSDKYYLYLLCSILALGVTIVTFSTIFICGSRKRKKLKIKSSIKDRKGLKRSIIKLGFACKSKLFILPMQDLVGSGSEKRINEPGTVKEQNWSIRFKNKDFNKRYQNRLLKLTEKYQRT